MFSSLIKWKKFPKFDAGANDAKGMENCGSSLKQKLTSQLCRVNRACVGSRFLQSESADEDVLNIQKIVQVRQLQVIDEVAVNTIPPDTEIHEQTTTINGYGKVCTTTSTPSTSVRPLWTTT